MFVAWKRKWKKKGFIMKKVKEMIEWNNKTILTCFKKQSKIAVNIKDRMDFRKEMSKDDKTFQNTSKILQNDKYFKLKNLAKHKICWRISFES